MVNFAGVDLVELGPLEALKRSQTYALYCALVAAGIIVSQLRARRPQPGAGWCRGQFLPSAGVIAFFTLLLVFDGPYRHLPVDVHLRFLRHVLGLG